LQEDSFPRLGKVGQSASGASGLLAFGCGKLITFYNNNKTRAT
jgi:hypothetical protein